jgi:hypothetical protein
VFEIFNDSYGEHEGWRLFENADSPHFVVYGSNMELGEESAPHQETSGMPEKNDPAYLTGESSIILEKLVNCRIAYFDRVWQYVNRIRIKLNAAVGAWYLFLDAPFRLLDTDHSTPLLSSDNLHTPRNSDEWLQTLENFESNFDWRRPEVTLFDELSKEWAHEHKSCEVFVQNLNPLSNWFRPQSIQLCLNTLHLLLFDEYIIPKKQRFSH